MATTEKNRFLQIKTALAADALLIKGLNGTEGISMPFTFDLDLISEVDHSIKFEDVIGKNVTVSVELADGENRYFNGFISSFSQTQTIPEVETKELYFASYQATMVPWLWFLTTTSNLRIFQNKSVPDIVEQVFNDHGFNDYQLDLTGEHNPRVYCVQYRETDFNFVTRLLEEEGIYYFFQHESGKHTLILSDHPNGHPDLPNQVEVSYEEASGLVFDEDYIDDLDITMAIKPGKYALNDFNFETPTAKLLAEVESTKNIGPIAAGIYDYPGEYNELSEGDNRANYRMQDLEAQIKTITGTSNVRDFMSGYKFMLENFPRDDITDKVYVLTSVSHNITQGGFRSGSDIESSYSNSFTCIPHDVPFRPPLLTPKPLVEGVQTAIVVGPSGEEIHTDEHGRVKVQFHWDREGKADENSSCWIRVSQPLAGSGWGAMFLPRIGQEVIVSFLEGDPDQPIITGRVYHGTNKPPYELPAQMTKSTIKTNSSKGGGGFNEIRFEDKKGEEQVFIHSQKNFDLHIENDRFETIGNDRHLHVGNDKKENIGNNRHEQVGADHYEKIGKDRHVSVKGKEAIAVDGSHSFSVGGDVIEVFKANHSEQTTSDYYLKADNIVIEGMTNVTVKVGQSYIAIEAGGIKIGTMGTIELEATNQVKVKGTAGVKIESPATAEVKSTSTTIKGDAMTTISGGLVKIN